MRNGNPLTGLRIVRNQEERSQPAQQRIHINLQRQIHNSNNNIIQEEHRDGQGEQERENQNHNNNQMDLI